MNKQLTEITNALKNADKICFFHHVMPDGDTFSSSYALMKTMQNNFPEKTIKWHADIEGISKFKKHLEINFDDVINELDDSWTVVIGDTSTSHRIYGFELYKKGGLKLCFDHHQNIKDFETNIFYHEPNYPASAIQSILIAQELGCSFKNKLGINFLYGVLTDTGFFKFSAGNPLPHQIVSQLYEHIDPTLVKELFKKMSFRTQDDLKYASWVFSNVKVSDGLAFIKIPLEVQKMFNKDPVDCYDPTAIANIQGVDVWIQYIEYPDFIRVEFRSHGEVEVNKIASQFGGGGHKHAAGCKLKSFTEIKAVNNATIKAITSK